MKTYRIEHTAEFIVSADSLSDAIGKIDKFKKEYDVSDRYKYNVKQEFQNATSVNNTIVVDNCTTSTCNEFEEVENNE